MTGAAAAKTKRRRCPFVFINTGPENAGPFDYALQKRKTAMKPTAIALASLLALGGTAALAQGASEQGAPTAAGANSMGSRTEPGAVKNGTSLGPGDRSGVIITDGTVGSVPATGIGASEQGAPTAAGANSMGSRTEPGAVKSGTSR
jgi:hypothetical protein